MMKGKRKLNCALHVKSLREDRVEKTQMLKTERTLLES
jgi:hypothetical protein